MNAHRDSIRIVKELVRLTPAHGTIFLLLIIAEGVCNALGQCISILGTKWLVDLSLGNGSVFQRLASWMVVYGICAAIVLFFLNSRIGLIYISAQNKMRRRIIKNMFSIRMNSNNIKDGDIISRYANDVEEVVGFLDGYVRGNALSLCTIITSFVFGAMLEWRCLILTLVAGVLMMALSMLLTKPMSTTANAFYSKQSNYMDKMIKMAQGIAQIRVFPRRKAFLLDLNELNADIASSQENMKIRYLFVDALMEVIMTLYRVLYIILGIYIVNRWGLSVSVLLASQQASMMIMGSIGGIASLFSLQQGSVTAAKRVLDIMKEPVLEYQRGHEWAYNDNVVSIENVSFAWAEEKHVFSDLTFALLPGSCVQIVGANGSGKSTLLRLILGLIMPNEGRIRLLNVDTTDRKAMECLRRKEIGYVSQEPQFMTGSVRENIVGFSKKTDEEYLAHLAAVLDIEKHLNTVINVQLSGNVRGTGGLSGGEIQLIAMARAAYKHPSLLILDEPTSAMDSVSQSKVEKLIAELKRDGCAVLLVCHKEHAFETIVDKRWEMH